MKKEISQYLHLYLGCLVEYGYEGNKYIGQLTGKIELFGWEIFNTSLPFDIYHKVRSELIKPILRPLSDMSEGEKNDSRYLATGSTFQYAEKIRWLLSKHFDLFGLHDAGLCFYKNDKNELY